jgi:guanylate kinase
LSDAPSLLVVSAPSGTGKSTILARMLAGLAGIRFSVSHTTRPPREGERDGVQYHFADRNSFEEMVRRERFLEWAEVHGNLYGTSLAEYERARSDGVDLLLDLDLQGARQVRRSHPDAVSVFILPPSYADLEGRLRGRGADSEAAIRRRLGRALAEARHFDEYDHVLINEDLDACAEQLRCIVLAARTRAGYVSRRARAILDTFPETEEV